MVAVFAAIPVSKPDVAPIVATVVLLLLHEPPEMVFPKVVELPVHMAVLPVIAPGNVWTVMFRVATQPAVVV